MDGTLVAPDWPPLTLDELRPLIAQFPSLDTPIEIVSSSPRPLSAAAVVRTSSGSIFIKRHHHAVRDADGLEEEHRFLAHLHRARAAVPRVHVASNSHTAISTGEWTYEVHSIPPGIDLYGDAISWTPFRTSAHAHAAGRTLASLHRAAEGYDAPRRKVQPLIASFTIFSAPDPRRALEPFLAARPLLAANPIACANAHTAIERLAPFHTQLLPLLPSLAPLWTHNDLHASNLFWSDQSDTANATAVIDFGLADRTNVIHDLANAIERNIVEWLILVNDPAHPDDVPVHHDHLIALLEGYESIRPLSPAEAAALAPMTALCHAEFALSEADYFLGVLHSEEKSRMADDGWLLGHARWFHSAAGANLLRNLERWASTHTHSKSNAGARA